LKLIRAATPETVSKLNLWICEELNYNTKITPVNLIVKSCGGYDEKIFLGNEFDLSSVSPPKKNFFAAVRLS